MINILFKVVKGQCELWPTCERLAVDPPADVGFGVPLGQTVQPHGFARRVRQVWELLHPVGSRWTDTQTSPS